MSAKDTLWAKVDAGRVRPSGAGIPHLRRLPCIHEGAVVRPCKTCGGGESHHVRACGIHGECTRYPTADRAIAVCRSCQDYATAEASSGGNAACAGIPHTPRVALGRLDQKYTWVSTAQLVSDSVTLAGLVPEDAAGIVGVPRSGLLAATVIATHLHLPLFSLEPSGLRAIAGGSRGDTLRRAAGPLVVVDDTVYGGGAMRRARAKLAGRHAVYAAVYVRPEASAAVDFAARLLPSPHLLEWNFANNGPASGRSANPVYGRGVAFDLDGILCHDAESGGPIGTPYLPARQHPIPLIATGRAEATRPQTEAWLTRQGIRFERLEMLPDTVALTADSAAWHKARHYKASGCGFFVESCPTQASLIHYRTGKPVICPRAGKVFQ